MCRENGRYGLAGFDEADGGCSSQRVGAPPDEGPATQLSGTHYRGEWISHHRGEPTAVAPLAENSGNGRLC